LNIKDTKTLIFIAVYNHQNIILMPAVYNPFADVAAIACYTERGNKCEQPDYKQDVSFWLHIPPLLHQYTDNIAEEDEHRHMKNPAGKLEITHFDMAQSIEKELEAPESTCK
jgi:hypothetical protein